MLADQTFAVDAIYMLNENTVVPLTFFVPFRDRSLDTRYENDKILRGATSTRISRCVCKTQVLKFA